MPTFLRIAPSWRSFIPMMFWPWIQISPESGSINPTMCLSKTLLPPPLRPMMTRVSPLLTLRSTPRKISCCPIFFCNERTAIMGEELSETKGGSSDIFGDGGASITVAQTFDSQPASLNCAALLIPRRINNVEHHGEKKIADQDRERGVHHCLSGCPTDANCALACGQSFLAADEYDEYSETERF
ncbi:MAG: hypothetical protein Udaeo_13460 [Candidatus Udaeobacter sp.]|nr:MAG: hypothetical protein Udaeo_13460 [Candidatus Udaeobacter sp.]